MVSLASSAAPSVQVIARAADVRLRLSRAVEAAGLSSTGADQGAGPGRIDVVVTRDLDGELLVSLPSRAGVIVIGGDASQVAAALSSSGRAFGIVAADAEPDALKAAILAVAAGFRVLPVAMRPTRLTPDR